MPSVMSQSECSSLYFYSVSQYQGHHTAGGQQSSQEHGKNHQCVHKLSELALTWRSKVHTMFLLSLAKHDNPN